MSKKKRENKKKKNAREEGHVEEEEDDEEGLSFLVQPWPGEYDDKKKMTELKLSEIFLNWFMKVRYMDAYIFSYSAIKSIRERVFQNRPGMTIATREFIDFVRNETVTEIVQRLQAIITDNNFSSNVAIEKGDRVDLDEMVWTNLDESESSGGESGGKEFEKRALNNDIMEMSWLVARNNQHELYSSSIASLGGSVLTTSSSRNEHFCMEPTCGKKSTKLLFCSRCQTHEYCNRQCQKKHWKIHKKTCIINQEDGV
jgi:MYND finger